MEITYKPRHVVMLGIVLTVLVLALQPGATSSRDRETARTERSVPSTSLTVRPLCSVDYGLCPNRLVALHEVADSAVSRESHGSGRGTSPTALLVAQWARYPMSCESDPTVEVPPGSGRWHSDSDSYPDALGIRARVWMWAGGPSYVLGPHRRPASPLVQIRIGERLQALLGVKGEVPDIPCGAGYGVWTGVRDAP